MFERLKQFWRRRPVMTPQVNGAEHSPAIAARAAPVYLSIAPTPENKALGTLAEEMDEDYQVQLAAWVIQSMGKTCRVEIGHNAPNDPRANALQKHLETLWQRTFESMFEARGKGRVAYEKVLAYDAEQNLHYVRKLEPLPYEDTAMQFDAAGYFAGITLGSGDDAVTLGPEKSWWLALRSTPKRPYGTSEYCGAPRRVFEQRKKLFDLRMIGAKRQILGVAKAHIPATVKNPQTGQEVDYFELFGQQYQAIQSGGCFMLPNSRSSKDGEFDQDIEFAEPTDLSPIDNMIDGTDAEQLRSFGITESVLMEVVQQPAGSYAKMSLQMQLLMSQVEGRVENFASSFDKYVVAKAPANNWPPETAPKFWCRLIRQTTEVVDPDSRGPSDDAKPDGQPDVGQTAAVADTALNGAQVESLLSIVEQVNAGTLPVDSALAMIDAAFPALEAQQIEAIIGPLRAMKGSAAAGGGNATGEMSGLTRQQLIRNWKAIDDVLDKLKSGEHSEQKARTMLSSLGLVGQTIDDLIADALGTPAATA